MLFPCVTWAIVLINHFTQKLTTTPREYAEEAGEDSQLLLASPSSTLSSFSQKSNAFKAFVDDLLKERIPGDIVPIPQRLPSINDGEIAVPQIVDNTNDKCPSQTSLSPHDELYNEIPTSPIQEEFRASKDIKYDEFADSSFLCGELEFTEEDLAEISRRIDDQLLNTADSKFIEDRLRSMSDEDFSELDFG